MNEREIQSLLALAAKRLHTTPEALRAAAENGDLQNIMGGQNNAAASQLNRVLSDPQSMAQLQGVMNSLGMNPPQAPAPASPPVQQKPAAAAPLNLLNTLNNSDPMTAMLLRAAPLLASANREDDSTRLLAALRPLLGEARQKKLDEASKILKLLHLLPLLKESGVLQNIL